MERGTPDEHAEAGDRPDASAAQDLLTVTPKAVAMVKEALAREGLGDDYGLRVGVVGGGCSGFQYSLNFDNQVNEDDQVLELGGVRLLVDSMSTQYLKGVTIDYVSSLHGAGFKFLNPNASRTCGCGSSFSA
jgi:iron-sulfur cluster assembly accessory protein